MILLLEVVTKAIYYVSAPDISRSSFLEKHICHVSDPEFAIHFWREGLPGTEVPHQLIYNARQEIPKGHQDFPAVISRILFLSNNEILCGYDHSVCDKKLMSGISRKHRSDENFEA